MFVPKNFTPPTTITTLKIHVTPPAFPHSCHLQQTFVHVRTFQISYIVQAYYNAIQAFSLSVSLSLSRFKRKLAGRSKDVMVLVQGQVSVATNAIKTTV